MLEIFERSDGLLAVDADIALLVKQRSAVRPQQPVRKPVAVAYRVAEGETCGLSGFLQLLTKIRKSVLTAGTLWKPGGLNHRLAIDQRTGGRAERQSDPRIALLT